jgi:hypothetical protein
LGTWASTFLGRKAEDHYSIRYLSIALQKRAVIDRPRGGEWHVFIIFNEAIKTLEV